MSFSELAVEIHRQAVASGFHDQPRRLPEILTLAHSELSEAFDAWRDNPDMLVDYNGKTQSINGWAVEIIDCIIVCLDILATNNIDVDTVLQLKMDFNKTRPMRHGRGI